MWKRRTAKVVDYYEPQTTPRSAAVLYKLRVTQPVKKFPAFYGTLRFKTEFKTDRHLSLCQINLFHALPTYFLNTQFNIIVSLTLEVP
jgi:hypothetical protein